MCECGFIVQGRDTWEVHGSPDTRYTINVHRSAGGGCVCVAKRDILHACRLRRPHCRGATQRCLCVLWYTPVVRCTVAHGAPFASVSGVCCCSLFTYIYSGGECRAAMAGVFIYIIIFILLRDG